jgi:hypothetical protein
MKKLLLWLILVLLSFPVHAQSSTLYSNSTSVGIGTNAPTTGSALDLSYNTNSALLPVGTTGQRPTGVNGMMRYNSTVGAIEGYIGGAWASILSTGTGFSSCTQVTGPGSDNPDTASCAAGYTLAGGGFDGGTATRIVIYSKPSGQGWTCSLTGGTCVAYAICCH